MKGLDTAKIIEGGLDPRIGTNYNNQKIKEELLMNEEGLQKTKNELIFIGTV
jgi:hypothetical protein